MTVQQRIQAGEVESGRWTRSEPGTARSRPDLRRQPTPGVDQPARDARLMTTAEVAEMLNIPLETLYAWRQRRLGPLGYRVGRHIRYRRSAVESWLETQVDQRD